MMTTVEYLRVFEDSSGAEALVTCGEFRWSFNFIAGEVRAHRIAGPQSHRVGAKKSLALAQHAYTSELRKRLGDGFESWVAANVAMYADEAL